MKIAVIGTGNVGSALGGSLARAGHEVIFSARDDAKAAEVATAVGATSASPADATRAAEVVVLAVPYAAIGAVAEEVADAAAGKVVVDVTNPLKADYSGLVTGDGPSAAEQVAAALPEATVVKAFNTVFGSVQGNPDVHGTTLDALFATDSEAAAATIGALASSIGFRPVKVGPLAAARELEALAWLNIRLQLLSGGNWQTAYKLVAPPESAVAA